jgi:hypothetical protein
LWAALDDGPETLVRITREHRSSCWGGQFPQFIDRIVMNPGLAQALVPGSFSELVFDERAARFQRILSGHCPVSFLLNVPP